MDTNDTEHICPPSALKKLNNPLRRLVHNPRRLFGEYIHPGDTVLDLGCGGGFFTVDLARMVGEDGRVIAVDVQQEMLDFTRKTVEKKGVLDRVTLHLCRSDDLALDGVSANFALAFYLVHEIPDREAFFDQVARALKPGARFMLVEPKGHASPPLFEKILADAEAAGLKQERPLRIVMSRGVFLQKI